MPSPPQVDAFRRQRGLLDAGKHACHSCQAQQGGCSWAQLEASAWICERSGFVHVCGAKCAFRELDPSSDLQVWTPLGSFTAGTDGHLVITDTAATTLSRFYRFNINQGTEK